VLFRSHGDCLVPKRYTQDPKLGTWVETQRVQYKKLSRETEGLTSNNRLNTERLHRLEGIGFCWSAKNLRKTKASTTPLETLPVYSEAAAYIKQDPEPANHEIDFPDPLSPPPKPAAKQARQRLNDLQWNEMYQRLEDYKEKYGDTLVPKRFEYDTRLATWVETQRILYSREQKDEGWDAVATPEDAAEVAATMGEANMDVVDHLVGNAEEDEYGDSELDDETKLPIKRLTEDRKLRLDQLGFVWSLRSKRVDDHWDDMYRQLCEYKDTFGDCLVPSRYEANMKLGKWVETQRYEYTKLHRASIDQVPDDSKKATNPRLTDERRRRLQDIGFEWKVKHKMKRYYDRQWEAVFDKLMKFKEDNGHCLVPKRYPPDPKLGTWVHTQRIQFRKLVQGSSKKDDEDDNLVEESKDDENKDDEQSYRLTEDRRRRLEEAGFVWSARENEKFAVEPSRITRNSYDDQWDSMFDRLVMYKDKHGDCLVPKRCKEDQKLGTWVDTQRVQYKRMRKRLAKEGIPYLGPHSIDCDDDPASTTSRKPLIGRLTDDRVGRLESLGFIWSLRDDWQKHYLQLTEYKKEYGHCNVPARYAKNRRLGIWVSAQRQQYKATIANQFLEDDDKRRGAVPLTQDRIDLLNDLGFTWTIRSRDSMGESWNQRFEELKQFKEEFGNCHVPTRYLPNPELGIWVGTQRTQYRLFLEQKGIEGAGTRGLQVTSMNDTRVRQLEELGFAWAFRAGQDSNWRKRFLELLDFRDLHQHTQVPRMYAANPRLGEWAAFQREQYQMRAEGQESSLDDDKLIELSEIGFSWEEPSIEISAEVDRVATEAQVHIPIDYDDEEGAQIVAVDDIEQYVSMGHHQPIDSLAANHGDIESMPEASNVQDGHGI